MTATTTPARRQSPPTWQLALGGVCWILSAQFFIAQAVAQSAWTTPYSLLDNAISDLGNTACGRWPPAGLGSQLAQRLGVGNGYICSPLHTVMNVSFVTTGALLLLGLFFTRHAWPRRRLTRWGFAFLALAGLGKILVGLSPENTNLVGHELGGLGIPCSIIGMMLLGLAVRHTHRWVSAFTLTLSGIGLSGLLGGVVATALGHDHGLAERLADYPAILWMIAVGTFFVAASRSARLDTLDPMVNRTNGFVPRRASRALGSTFPRPGGRRDGPPRDPSTATHLGYPDPTWLDHAKIVLRSGGFDRPPMMMVEGVFRPAA